MGSPPGEDTARENKIHYHTTELSAPQSRCLKRGLRRAKNGFLLANTEAARLGRRKRISGEVSQGSISISRASVVGVRGIQARVRCNHRTRQTRESGWRGDQMPNGQLVEPPHHNWVACSDTRAQEHGTEIHPRCW